METMTPAERHAFLTAGTRTMKVATARADGRPHVTPVWFALDGDTVVFTTDADSIKGVSLRRDPRVSLCVDDDQSPFAHVLIEGIASLSDDPEELVRWATITGGRYMGATRAEEYGRRNGVPGELLVRVAPTKIIARKGIAD